MHDLSVCVTVNLECAHTALDGRLHGHSYLVECWTHRNTDLDEYYSEVNAIASQLDHTELEKTINPPTMEEIAHWFFNQISHLCEVVVIRPTLGFKVSLKRYTFEREEQCTI